jgi:hypothetical protein
MAEWGRKEYSKKWPSRTAGGPSLIFRTKPDAPDPALSLSKGPAGSIESLREMQVDC